jgi:hypothetical protein
MTQNTHPLAQVAIKAAKNRKVWGRYASIRYAINKGVPLGLYRLACQLENTREI